jgi:hypothetical protein
MTWPQMYKSQCRNSSNMKKQDNMSPPTVNHPTKNDLSNSYWLKYQTINSKDQ